MYRSYLSLILFSILSHLCVNGRKKSLDCSGLIYLVILWQNELVSFHFQNVSAEFEQPGEMIPYLLPSAEILKLNIIGNTDFIFHKALQIVKFKF